MPVRHVHSGAAFSVLVHESSNGRCRVEEYLEQLPLQDRKRITAMLERVAERGPLANTEQSAPIEDFFEFKAYQIRVFWRYASDRRIVLFHGFTKKSGRTPRNELATGRRRWRETLAELGR